MTVIAHAAPRCRHDEILNPVRSAKCNTLRDSRLDFWRGLCLLDMILVHLVYDGVNFGPIQRAVGEYTRFAAGGFVFVAGLSIGAIFLPRLGQQGGRRKVYSSLLRRSLYILAVHFAATLSFVALDLIRGMRPDAPPMLHLLRDILLFREGGDLLPLYVIVVAASPLILELLHRRLGWLLAVISACLFAWGQNHPWAFSTPLRQNFPVILWQAVFVAGALFGSVLQIYSAISRRRKILLATAAGSVSLLLWAADFRSDFGWAYPNIPLVFCKAPLSFGEMLRYFGLIFFMVFTTDLLWAQIAGSRLIQWTSRLGRRSLAVYVAHVWFVSLLATAAWKTQWLGAWQMLFALPAVVACWGIAWLLDWNSARAGRSAPAAISGRLMPIPLASVASALAVLICAQLFPPPPATPVPSFNSIDRPDSGARQTDSDAPIGPSFDPVDTPDMIPV